MPKRNPFCTLIVCCPSKVASVTTSVNQKHIVNKNKKKVIVTNNRASELHTWNHVTILNVKANKEHDVNKGHGLFVTKWKGCCCFDNNFINYYQSWILYTFYSIHEVL